MATDAQIKAEQANQVLANPVFLEAFDDILETTVQSIADAEIADSETRNQLGLLLAAATSFKELMFEHIRTAQLEASNDAQENEHETLPLDNG